MTPFISTAVKIFLYVIAQFVRLYLMVEVFKVIKKIVHRNRFLVFGGFFTSPPVVYPFHCI